MLNNRRCLLAALVLLVVGTTGHSWTEPKYQLVTANGNGTLKVGTEEFKITAVVIKLLGNGKAEINLISEITVFVSGSWSRSAGAQNEIDVQIAGGASGGFEGSGKLILRSKKSIDRLNLTGTSRTSKRQIEVSFVSE